ncbi:MAG: xanthine dehydrogenase family protein molybdopterin-binding subunit [Nitrososphaerales archaeon]
MGVASYVQTGGFGPSKMLPARMGGYESTKIRMEPDGNVSVFTGTSPSGQGFATTLSQIVGESLQIPMEDIRVISGDTMSVPYGMGTSGSRNAAVGGQSALMACHKMVDKAKKIVSILLNTESEIILEGGLFYSRDSPNKKLDWKQIADEASFVKNLPSEMDTPLLEVTALYHPANLTSAFGAHAALVEIDPETGKVSLKKYYGVDDCGRILNPMIVEGQMQGGIVQGIGEALYEEVLYDDQGQLLTSSLLDYAIPSSVEVPQINLDEMETIGLSEIGTKGIGEAGAVVSIAAVANAVSDALSHRGTDILKMPFDAEHVWLALKENN